MRTLMAVLLIIGVALSQPAPRYEQSRLLFREALVGGSKMIEYLENSGLEVVKVDMDLVSVNNTKQTLKTFSAGFTYTVAARGQPSRIQDLDISILYIDASGTPIEVGRDNATDNNPVVTFHPSVSGTYTIVVRAAKMVRGEENSSGFYFLVVAHN